MNTKKVIIGSLALVTVAIAELNLFGIIKVDTWLLPLVSFFILILSLIMLMEFTKSGTKLTSYFDKASFGFIGAGAILSLLGVCMLTQDLSLSSIGTFVNVMEVLLPIYLIPITYFSLTK